MKSQHSFIFSLFIFIFLIAASRPAYASHAAGGEITYTHLTGNCYIISMVFYRDCMGIPIVLPIQVNIASASCAQGTVLTLDPVPGTGQEVTMPCPGGATTCMGGTEPGFQRWEFEAQYCFPGQCADWVISSTISARNVAITTLVNPGSENIYIEARLNNLSGDNNSPQFAVSPRLFVCVDQDIIFNNGLVDPDGDSLVYSLIPARSDVNTSVVYSAGYSFLQPLSSSPPITIDPQTGTIFMHPTGIEVGVIVYQIQEFRNGVMIGSIMRDEIIYSITCANQTPVITGVNGTTLSSFYVLPGGAFCFNVFSFDPDMNDILTMTWDLGIPAGTFTTIGSPFPTGVFCWSPTLADVSAQPHIFTVTLRDNACPLFAMTMQTFSITVTLDSSLVQPLGATGYISGNVYYDVNFNGIKDSTELSFPLQMIDIQPDGLTIFTDNGGNYLFYPLSNGSHLVSLLPSSGWHITSDSLSYTVTDDSLNQSGFDFGINADSVYNKLDVHIAPGIPRCLNTAYYCLNYENTGTTLLNGRVYFVMDNTITFLSSTPPPDLVSADTLFYNFTNLWPFESRQIPLVLQMPAGGTIIHMAACVQFDSSGVYYTSGDQSIQQTVTCSYDPNDKTVLPVGLYAEHRTLYTEPLLYTIRFQNTGNDTAFTVAIRDFIDPSLDLNTFHVTGSSHPMNTILYPNRMAEFKFENILLPDSVVDEPGSHGFIQYKIFPLTNISLPAVVHNDASIYFDSNFPVATNTVFNTLVSELNVSVPVISSTTDNSIVIPNPFSNEAEIVLGTSFKNSETELRVVNSMGELVLTKNTGNASISISRGKLAQGIYFYEVKNRNGNRAVGKFVIE